MGQSDFFDIAVASSVSRGRNRAAARSRAAPRGAAGVGGVWLCPRNRAMSRLPLGGAHWFGADALSGMLRLNCQS